MAYLLYKLKFPNGLHIGANNSLESTSISVHSDTFYSALYSEYIKLYGDNKLFEITKNGNFLISDLFPFKEKKSETNFYLPKPFVNIGRKKVNDLEKDEKTVDRKKVKRLNFIPASKLKEYFSFLENGENFPEIDDDFGEKQLYTKNKISRLGEDTELYNVEVFKFNENSGLYFIVQLLDEWKEKFENVLESLAFTGIGGKKTAGYGQFEILDPFELTGNEDDYSEGEDDIFINNSLYKEEKNYIILSSYAPIENEITKLKDSDNCYQLIKRSGFVNNVSYSDEPQKRKQVYMISSGAVLDFKPSGRILDLNLCGNHSIYRMGKPIIMGVDLWER